MEGKTHVVFSAGVYGLVGVPAMALLGQTLSPAEVAAGMLLAGGAGLLPDLDTGQSTVARSLGPVTGTLGHVVGILAGGHRNGTHSLLAVIGFGALLWGPLSGADPLWHMAISFLATSLALRALGWGGGAWDRALFSAIITLALFAYTPGIAWVAPALWCGYVLHLIGDMLTPEGVPPLWPILPKWRTGVALFTTGTRTEGFARFLSMGMAICAALMLTIYPSMRENQPEIWGASAKQGREIKAKAITEIEEGKKENPQNGKVMGNLTQGVKEKARKNILGQDKEYTYEQQD